VSQADAVKAFCKAGGVERRKTKRGHAIIKMPNGKIVSLPTGVLLIGLLKAQIKVAGMSDEEFDDLL
jgi:hypothetical protein